MTQQQFAELLNLISNYYSGFRLTNEQARVWYERKFKHYPFEDCMAAVDKYAEDNAKEPHLSQIRILAKEIFEKRMYASRVEEARREFEKEREAWMTAKGL